MATSRSLDRASFDGLGAAGFVCFSSQIRINTQSFLDVFPRTRVGRRLVFLAPVPGHFLQASSQHPCKGVPPLCPGLPLGARAVICRWLHRDPGHFPHLSPVAVCVEQRFLAFAHLTVLEQLGQKEGSEPIPLPPFIPSTPPALILMLVAGLRSSPSPPTHPASARKQAQPAEKRVPSCPVWLGHAVSLAWASSRDQGLREITRPPWVCWPHSHPFSGAPLPPCGVGGGGFPQCQTGDIVAQKRQPRGRHVSWA